MFLSMKLKLIIVFIFLFVTKAVRSQYYTSGEDPSSLKWNTIETENFKLVFSENYTDKAQYLAKILEEIYLWGGQSLDHTPKKISVLIHPETTYSNGFVTWAPKRIELFPTPNQNIYAQEWLQQLAVHEFRHVVQIDKLNKGFTKILSYILGEQAIGGILGLYMPMWFLEGDAVVTETALTNTGRGRSPWFEQGLRAQVMEKDIYSYDKAYFGSYKDFVPNYYELGYQLVAGARDKYGLGIWNQQFYDLVSNSTILYPFLSIKKRKSRIDKTQLYNDIMSDLHDNWIGQDSIYKKTPFKPITIVNNEYLSFKYPTLNEDGNIIAEISGPGEIERFVQIDSVGDYKTVFVPGALNDEPFSYSNNILCWTEFVADKRWENRGWSIIKCYDINTRNLKIITKKSRYFSPSLNSKSSYIVAVKALMENSYALSVINRKSGEEERVLKYDDSSFYLTPSWSKNDDKITCICVSKDGKKIVTYNTLTSQWTDVTDFTLDDISRPIWKDEHTILFTAGYSGTEEIYSVNIETKQIRQLTQSEFGSTDVIFDSKADNYIYSRYNSDGFQLVYSTMDQVSSIPLNQVENHSNKLYQKISEQEKNKVDFSGIDTIPDYSVSKYSKIKNLLNFHSWAPANVNIDDQTINSGLSVFSQNLLGTAITSIGYNADSQNSKEKYHFNFQYRGWYPIIELDVKHGDEKISDGLYAFDTDTAYISKNPKQYQTELEVGLNLPLSFTKDKFYRYLQPSLNYNLLHLSGYETLGVPVTRSNNNYIQDGEPKMYYRNDISYSTLEYSLYMHNLLKVSERDVNYRWGQIIEGNFQSTPFNGVNVGKILGFRTRMYFPGLLKHHSVKIDNEYQYKWKGERYESSSDDLYLHFYRFGNYYNYARGYINYTNDELYSLKVNYMFPLWNPDLSIPGLLYAKRITTNLYFDYSRSSLTYYLASNAQKIKVTNEYKSIGAEFLCETHIFRFLFPINIGYRYSRLLDFNANHHELLMGINISGFSIGK